MSRKRKGALPSGNVRVRVFVGIRPDGTKRYESFTAPSRQQAEELAYAFRASARAQIASGVPVDGSHAGRQQARQNAKESRFCMRGRIHRNLPRHRLVPVNGPEL